LQLDGPVQAGEGLYGFTLFEQAGTEVGVVVGDVGLQRDDAPEVGEALVLAPRVHFDQSDQVDEVGRLGEVLLELAIEVLRLDEFSRAMEFHRMVKRGLGVGELHVVSEAVVVEIARINSSGAGRALLADHLISW
jgi:hypothetical protein